MPESVSSEAFRSQEQHIPEQLSEKDIRWIADFTGDEASAHERLPQLQELARDGSVPLVTLVDPLARDNAFAAREQFLLTLGVEQGTLDRLKASQKQRAYIGPTSTFIGAQRYLTSLDIDARRLYRMYPQMLNRPAEGWRQQVAKISQHGHDPVTVLRHTPKIALGPDSGDRATEPTELRHGVSYQKLVKRQVTLSLFSTKEINARLDRLEELGINPRLAEQQPGLISLSHKALRQKLEFLHTSGLEALSVANRNPVILTLAIDTIQSKMDNLDQLGLDSRAIINRWPNILTTSEQTVRRRFRLLNHIAAALEWQGSVTSLLNTTPNLMATADKKLLLLGRIAAIGLSSQHTSLSNKEVAGAQIVPLEYYVLALDSNASGDGKAVDVIRDAKSLQYKKKYSADERKERARQIASHRLTGNYRQSLIARQYLAYSAG